MAQRRSTKAQPAPDAQTRVLVIYGPEEALKRQARAQLLTAMDGKHGAVDELYFDGKTCELAQVLDELRSFGLMAQYKIVIVDEADAFVTTHRAALERYTANPVDHGTLVLQCTRWHKGNLDKLITKVGCIIKCEPLKPAQIKALLIEHAQSRHHRKLSSQAAQMLTDRLGGGGLMRLENELAKLAVLVGDGEAIGPELIDQVVGRSSDEQAWAIQEALLAAMVGPQGAGPGAGPGAAIEKIHELVDLSRQADVLVAYFIADLIRKLHHGRMMRRQGVAPGRIASELKLWGPRQAAFMGALDRLGDRATDQLLDRIIRYDARAKSGFGQAMRNIECFCATLDDEIR